MAEVGLTHESTGISRRLENLRPWPKGVSGNPTGRPRLPLELKRGLHGSVQRLLELVGSEDEAVALKAAALVLAYNLGPPVGGDGDDAPTLTVEVARQMHRALEELYPEVKNANEP